jgi:hypothetical protein
MLMRSPPRGATLVELLVTTVVGSVVLTLITAVCLREQRVFTDLSDQTASSSQLQGAEAIVPIDVRAASSIAGDVREARDTSMELRAIVASAVVCDSAGGGVVLAPSVPGAQTYGSSVLAIAPGDTAWVLFVSDSTEAWRPYRIASTNSQSSGACAARGPGLDATARATPRTQLVLDSLPPGLALGRPLRVTRPLRYSIYRGSDASWYLGQRDWNTATMRFNSIQPVSGPFLPPAADGVVFHYLDSAGVDLPVPVPDTRRIAVVRVELRSGTKLALRALASRPARGPRVDSAALWILLRNRR